jgi:hypothetical protein
VSHLHIPDVLNWMALSANLVPATSIVAASLARGRWVVIVDLFLLGLNLLQILTLVAAALACVFASHERSREQELLDAARHRAPDAEAPAEASAAPAQQLAPQLAPAPSPPEAHAMPLPSERMQAAQLVSAVAQRWLSTPPDDRRSGLYMSEGDDSEGEEPFPEPRPATTAAPARTSEAHEAADASAQRSELTPTVSRQNSGRSTRFTALLGEAGRSEVTPTATRQNSRRLSGYTTLEEELPRPDVSLTVSRQRRGSSASDASVAEVQLEEMKKPATRLTRQSSRRVSQHEIAIGVAPLLAEEEEGQEGQEGQAAHVAQPAAPLPPAPSAWQQTKRFLHLITVGARVKTIDQTAHAIKEGGADLAVLRAAGQYHACLLLCRRVEAACCRTLARLQQERDAAVRDAAPRLAAAAEASMGALERLFREHGFETWILAEGSVQHGLDRQVPMPSPDEDDGVSAGATLVVTVTVLLTVSLAVGLGTNVTLAIAGAIEAMPSPPPPL